MYTKTKLRKAQNIREFEEIYKKLEQTCISEFGNIIAKKNRRLIICTILLMIATASLILVFIQSLGGQIDLEYLMVTAIALLLTLIVSFFRSSEENNFVKNYKKRIIGMLVKEIEQGLEYMPECHNKNDILASYEEMGFERSNCNQEYLDDVITGKIGDAINSRITNACIKKIITPTSGVSIIFNGLFAEIDLEKNINADIRILLPTTGYVGNAENCEKIEMDSQEFEKQFNVYTNNKIITTRLLTSDVMEKLRGYYEKYGMKFDLVIKNNKACIRVETGSMFESIETKNKLHKEDTFVYYSVMNFMFGLLKDIYNIIENSEI